MIKDLPFITPEDDFELNLLLTFQIVLFFKFYFKRFKCIRY